MSDTVVEIEPDDAVVTIDVSDGPPAAAPAASPEAPNAVDRAADTLTAAMQRAEVLRKAAEETAASERRRADAAAAEAQSARERAQSQEATILAGKIESEQAAFDAAKRDLVAAHEEGDFVKVADAQSRMSQKAARIERLTAEKEAAETRQPTHEGRVPQNTVEGYLSAYTPRAQSFLRAHMDCLPPEAGGDPKKNARMMEGHYAALRQGHAADSDNYFQVIESYLQDPDGAPAAAPAAAAAAPASPTSSAATLQPAAAAPRPAAPVSRAPHSANGGTSEPTSVRLSKEQQEIALLSFPQRSGEQDAAWRKRAFGNYAREYVKAKAEGAIGRMTH